MRDQQDFIFENHNTLIASQRLIHHPNPLSSTGDSTAHHSRVYWMISK